MYQQYIDVGVSIQNHHLTDFIRSCSNTIAPPQSPIPVRFFKIRRRQVLQGRLQSPSLRHPLYTISQAHALISIRLLKLQTDYLPLLNLQTNSLRVSQKNTLRNYALLTYLPPLYIHPPLLHYPSLLPVSAKWL